MTMTIFWILAILSTTLFALQIVRVARYQRSIKKAPVLQVVRAGSEKPGALKELKVTNLDLSKFHTKDGNPINYENLYITMGDSMLLGGIRDKDIVYVEKNPDEIEYPAFVVIRREPQAIDYAKCINDFAELKIRRAWKECNLGQSNDEISSIIESILSDEKFIKIKQLDEKKFPSNEWLISDFKERLKLYREEHEGCEHEGCDDYIAIISTTLDTMKNRVHFSIHSRKMLIGIVKHVYAMA